MPECPRNVSQKEATEAGVFHDSMQEPVFGFCGAHIERLRRKSHKPDLLRE